MRHAIGLAALLALAAAAAQNDDIFRTDDVPQLIETRSADWTEWGLPYLPVMDGSGQDVRLRGEPMRDRDCEVGVDVRRGGDRLMYRKATRRSRGPWLTLRGPADHIGDVDIVTVSQARELAVWDEYSGDVARGASFDVLGAWLVDGEWGAPFVIAGGPRFQVRPSPAVSSTGDVWVAWEEGPENWGAEYRSVDGLWNNVTDSRGPLHTWREVRLGRVFEDGSIAEVEGGVPMPSFEAAKAAADRRPDAERIGVFYERPEIAFDRLDGLWLAYRHVHQAQLSAKGKTRTHVEYGFAVDLRRLDDDGWSSPMRLDQRQRDGEQPLFFRTTPEFGVVYGVGRSDRRKDDQAKGWVKAALSVPEKERTDLSQVTLRERRKAPAPELAPHSSTREFASADVRSKTHTLLFGDLHRHTDLSLCFPFYDGSLDDAYRYARGPGALDFVAITDHARDLDQGNVEGEPWRRTVEQVRLHDVPGRFAAFFSYERSQGHTDHNVISLRPDVLRPHKPPLREFWAEFSPDELITIPHATSPKPGTRFCGNIWTKRDDERRPLAEIYQAYRDVDSLKELQVKALAGGQKLGFIASSDHLATSGGYACVWAEGSLPNVIGRQPIFDALRARRTYGATARIELRATCGEAWMGEELAGDGPFPIDVHVRGAGALERIELWSTGELAHTVECNGDESADLAWAWPGAPADAHGWLIVRVVQKDGHQAWSSPFFAAWDRAGETKY